ncbi:MAG: ATP-binding protein [Caldilineaceae bacterium]
MKPSFVGREAELLLLDRLWARPGATLLILYGRRRVGKTRLLTYWARQGASGEMRQEQTARRVLYWVAEPSSARDQLRSFSQAVYNFANPQVPAPEDFTYANWQQAWQQVAVLAQSERLGLVLDEFTYLLEIDPSIAGQLQNLWDQTLSQANLFLVLCGSHLGMMLRHTLSYQAPLYGRATAQLRLPPLPFGTTARYFPHFDADERVAIYAIWGGIPAYWERLDPSATLSDNIRHELLTANNLMQAEPRLLLQDFVNEPHNYVGILRAIANDARTQGEIAAFSGLAQGHVSQYLGILQDAGFVERRVPVTQGERSRLGRYHIVDPYLRFYYRFLAGRQSQLALGIQEQSLAEIKRHLRDFIGANTWEELCREWLLRASAQQTVPVFVDQVGSAWTRAAQVDVVGVNSMEKTLVLGECKWGPEPSGRSIVTELVEKTAEIVPSQGQWQVYYLGFARAGWTAASHAFAQEIVRTSEAGKNWRTIGMRLLDLAQVDHDLEQWASRA